MSAHDIIMASNRYMATLTAAAGSVGLPDEAWYNQMASLMGQVRNLNAD